MIVILVLVAAAIAVTAHLRSRAIDERALRRRLGWFAGALLAQTALLHLAGWPALRGAVPGLVGLAAAAGLIQWHALSSLIAPRTRWRDLILRVPLLAAAAIVMIVGLPLVAGLLAVLGTIRYGWRTSFGTARLFQLGVAATALGLAVFSLPPPSSAGDLEGATRAFSAFARATAAAAGGHAWIGAVVLFGAFVRDPSLGIRRVRLRLALSHLLVVLVPLAMVLAMWVSTTVLGVHQERAGVGARAIAGEAEQLSSALDAALASAASERERLAAIAVLHAADWPGIRLWRRERGALERMAGDPLGNETALHGWLDSLDRRPARGLVTFGDSLFLGAASRAGGREALALAPLPPMLERLGRTAASRLGVNGTAGSGRPAPTAASDTARVTARDSIEMERMRRFTRRVGLSDSVVSASGRRRGSSRLVVGPDTFSTGRQSPMQILTQGRVMVKGLEHGADGWVSESFLITADVPTDRILAGLFDLSSENPFSYLPVVLLAIVGSMFFLILLWDVVMVTNMGRSITGAIAALREAAARMQAGDLAHRIEVRGRDDLWEVAEAFNVAAEGLTRAREKEKEQDRIENELQVARRIQERLLPAAPPSVPGLEIAGHYDPAREIGGDYFDHLPVGESAVLLVIADVSGKSVPAALIMSGFRAGLVSQDLERLEPSALAVRLNQLLHASLDPGKFVTAFLGLLDGASGRLTYVNAGHNPPVLLRDDGSYELLERGGTILGILPASSYERGQVTLRPGDLVALYTDGVSEGANAAGEQWGEPRLVAVLREDQRRPCAAIARRIAEDVRAFEGEQGATDDITLVVARRLG